jgi:2-oxoglutarate dehydrogenase E2 component (dihydrolipoamide succinyltransferase)
MVDSVHTSPHVLTVMEVDMTRVLAHRKANKDKYAADGVNLTLTAYFVAALAKALGNHKIVNATWTDEGIFAYSDVNIGMAVALGEGGLIVPVIKQAQNLSLKGIASQVNNLAERARNKKLKPDEVRDGTFTLTNHGTAGSLFAMPIINQPQLGILGTGAMQKRAVVITDENGNDSIAIRPMVYLSLVFDHRAIDGESGDNFLADVKKTLENWSD